MDAACYFTSPVYIKNHQEDNIFVDQTKHHQAAHGVKIYKEEVDVQFVHLYRKFSLGNIVT
jgi:hypothetical protein